MAVVRVRGGGLPRGAGVLLAWAFLPILANGYSWFHDVRMFFEAAPAWITLGLISAVALAGGLGGGLGGDVDGAPAPDPDAATSYAERRRLFDLPR